MASSDPAFTMGSIKMDKITSSPRISIQVGSGEVKVKSFATSPSHAAHDRQILQNYDELQILQYMESYSLHDSFLDAFSIQYNYSYPGKETKSL